MARLGKAERAAKRFIMEQNAIHSIRMGKGDDYLRDTGRDTFQYRSSLNIDKVHEATHRTTAYGCNGSLPEGRASGGARGVTQGLSAGASRVREEWVKKLA